MTKLSSEEFRKKYTKGEILMGFNKDVTEKEARELVSSLGLVSGEWAGATNILFVKVSEGTENEWIEKFKEGYGDKVIGTSFNLNLIVHTLEDEE